MFAFVLFLSSACAPATVIVDDGVVEGQPGVISTETDTAADSVIHINPYWNLPLTSTNSWRQTRFVFDFNADGHADNEPMVSVIINDGTWDNSENGSLVEMIYGADYEYVTIGINNYGDGIMYSADVIRDHIQIQQLDVSGQIVGYMVEEEGNDHFHATYKSCIGCDPPT